MSEDDRYYLPCPMRKNRARVPVTVCHEKRCLFLSSDGGKSRCGYGDGRFKIGVRPKVKRIRRDGFS